MNLRTLRHAVLFITIGFGLPLLAQSHPGIQQMEGWDPCMEFNDPDAIASCWVSSGSGGGGSSTCQCPSGAKCDLSIKTANQDTLTNSGCVYGWTPLGNGLKCFYWNPRTNANEVRLIPC